MGVSLNSLTSVVPDKRSADPGPIHTGSSLARTRSGSFAPHSSLWLWVPEYVASSVRHPVHRADLVAVGIAQIGDIELVSCALADARRIFDRRSAGGDASGVPLVDLLRRVGGKAD